MQSIGSLLMRSRVFQKPKLTNVNSLLLKSLSQKPIAFNPMLGRLAGSATAGLFLSQLLYWVGKGRDKESFFKTIEEFQRETCLTRSEQDRAIKIWRRLEVVDVKRKGIPPRRYFKVDIIKLGKLLELSPDESAEVEEMTK